MTKNDIFIMSKGNGLRITLLCGSSRTNDYVYFSPYTLYDDAVTKAQFANDVPWGSPIGDSMELKLNVNMFKDEYENLWNWIFENESSHSDYFKYNTLHVGPDGESTHSLRYFPNLWLVTEDKDLDESPKVYYAGVQSSASKTEFEFDKDSCEYTINTIGLLKYAFDKTNFVSPDFVNMPLEDVVLDTNIVDGYKKVGNPDKTLVVHRIKDWQVCTRMKFNQIMQPTYGVAQQLIQGLLRIEAPKQFVLFIQPLLSNFVIYKQNTETAYPNYGDVLQDISSDIRGDIYAIAMVQRWIVSSDNYKERRDGLYFKWKNKYKNLWNFVSKAYESLALRTYSYDGLVLTGSVSSWQILNIGVCQNMTPYKYLNETNLPAEKAKITIVGESRNEVMMQLQTVHNDDLSTIRKTVDNNLSQQKASLSMLVDSAPNKVTGMHATRDWDTDIGVRDYKEGDALPIYKLLYKDNYDGIGVWGMNSSNIIYKVSERVGIKVGTNQHYSKIVGNVSLSEVDDMEQTNNVIGEFQNNSMSSAIAEIISKLLLNKNAAIYEPTLDMDIANSSDIGKEYEIDLSAITEGVLLLKTYNFKKRAILVNCETNITTKKSKCKFFIRADEWA